MDFDGVLLDGVLGLFLPQMTLASSFLHCRQMLVLAVVAVAPGTIFSRAVLASDRDRVLERRSMEASSILTGLVIRDILLTSPAGKIGISTINYQMKNRTQRIQRQEHFWSKQIFPH